MATGEVIPKYNEMQRPGTGFTWTATILACAYFAWMGISLYLSAPAFMNMFGSMGVDLGLSTKLAIGTYRWSYPLLFGGAAALVIAKQFFVRDKWVSLSVTLATTVAMGVISDVIVRALYQPLFEMIEKLNK